ncbi:thioesterase family protein [Ancylobacter sp. TS-1]|uniref:acyl-CoA thioesterase n=1 Tax=Ancylobacter sp. TS-1 TaxID=1850374 RepID=UPI001265D239|nr:acyl-CoA thioesterase [Ancylobacter sp. TS-1]QFR34452.1 acyl-CoA thioesterase [Ancylobacter sp. TS-1]
MTIRTFQGVVYPAQCDAMGHMNVQHYVGVFDQATWHLFAACGYDSGWIEARREGWADVRQEIDYRQEVRAGELFVIDSAVRRVGGKSLTTWHRLSTARGVSAEMLAVTVYFDLAARRARELPDVVRVGALALLEPSPEDPAKVDRA